MTFIPTPAKHFLVASDFDQTLSFNDSGVVLSDLIGASNFQAKVDGLARCNLVQQGGELAYLIRHDPEFRGVRREHLVETGRRVRLRHNIHALVEFFDRGLEGHRFSFVVISAAPREVIEAALEGIVPTDRIFGTEFEYDPHSGEVRAIVRVPAGYGKVAVIEELEERLGGAPERTVYIGDGSSDVHVMLHVNNRGGFTMAVSENQQLARIARSTVLSDDAFSVTVPLLEQVLGWNAADIRSLFESNGLALQEWEKARTDRVIVRGRPLVAAEGGRMTTDVLGWAATAVFVTSYFFARPQTLRRVQMLGAAMWVIYGALLRASPVIVANVLVLAAAWACAPREELRE